MQNRNKIRQLIPNQIRQFPPGLPDFSWYNITKRENIQNDHKMAIQYTI
jgi:hypothetical protein